MAQNLRIDLYFVRTVKGFFSSWHQIPISSNVSSPTLWHRLGLLQFNLVLTLPTRVTIGLHKLRAQCHKAAPTSDARAKSQIVTSTSKKPVINLRGFDNILFRCNYSQEQQKTQEVLLLLTYYKLNNSGTSNKEIHRARYGGRRKEHRATMPSSGTPSCQHVDIFTNLKLSKLHCLGVLWRFHYTGTSCPLVIKLKT